MLKLSRFAILLVALSVVLPLAAHASIQDKQIRITRATGIFASPIAEIKSPKKAALTKKIVSKKNLRSTRSTQNDTAPRLTRKRPSA